MATRSSALRSKQLTVSESSAQPVVGRIVGVTDTGHALVKVAGGAAAVPAIVSTAITPEQLQIAAATKQAAVLIFARDRPDEPIVIGLLDSAHAGGPAVALAPPSQSPAAMPLEAVVDGKRVSIVATDELVLKCGSASITLRSNGRVVVRGAHVETDAQGVNRIKGGTVKIN
jgi:Domain of unknown function (DUF6484)